MSYIVIILSILLCICSYHLFSLAALTRRLTKRILEMVEERKESARESDKLLQAVIASIPNERLRAEIQGTLDLGRLSAMSKDKDESEKI